MILTPETANTIAAGCWIVVALAVIALFVIAIGRVLTRPVDWPAGDAEPDDERTMQYHMMEVSRPETGPAMAAEREAVWKREREKQQRRPIQYANHPDDVDEQVIG